MEYQIPNFLLSSQQLDEVEISLEIGSEAPGINPDWPSDISFSLNGHDLGSWTSPGDSGEGRGIFTPSWWSDRVNQYGYLKILRIQKDGTFIDGIRLSNFTLADLPAAPQFWTLRLAVDKTATHVGGLTIYGEGFGNYNQDIVFRTYYLQSYR